MAIDQVLMDIGLHETEVRFYLAALELGQAPMRDIARKAGISRTNAYDVFSRLLVQRLVNEIPHANDRSMLIMAEAPERVERARHLLGRLRAHARDADVRAAAEMDAARVGDAEREDVIGVALDEAPEAVLNTEHLDVRQARADRRGADDAVDAGRRSTANQNGEVLVVFHLRKDDSRGLLQ